MAAEPKSETALDASEDIGSNPNPRAPISDIIAARFGRRAMLGASAALAALAATPEAEAQGLIPRQGGPSSLSFPELRHQLAQSDAVAEGYEIQNVIRWGDPVLAGAPAFDATRVTPEAQALQFGYNNDFLDFFPLPQGSTTADHGLLVVNHEYTNTNLMFPGMGSGRESRTRSNAEQTRAEAMAHGLSVIEVKRSNGVWGYVPAAPHNRRITAETAMRISGPAAGAARMKTAADPAGQRVLGTLNNCAGGNTPWGTVLTGEENFNGYFGGDPAKTPHQAIMRRYGIAGESWYNWWRHMDRFNVEKEANESFRFGWVVEFDPYDPQSVPVKRTALGRFKHEGATHAISADGRVAFYSGDDERFEYVYKFVTARPWNPNDRAANRDLLDDGTLYVGKFHDDGKLEWLPLVHGQGPLTSANGFADQADVLIEARRAADLLGATPMDRPEDVEANPVNGRVYVMLTNNSRRTAEQVNRANPRARNV
ncbi:MAG: PhoX family protein, partial [Alphaproteobacteria bacterium]